MLLLSHAGPHHDYHIPLHGPFVRISDACSDCKETRSDYLYVARPTLSRLALVYKKHVLCTIDFVE